MKYVNLYNVFLMVHLCNIQMLAASTRHRLKGVNYDIDGFVSQLFASSRFVELVDKLSEGAANRIKYNFNKKSFIVSSNIDEAPVYNVKGTKYRSNGKNYDINGFINQVLASENVHELLAKLTVHAASKIMRTSTKRGFRAKSKSSHENLPKTHQVTNTKMREDPTGKIDLQTIINEMLSLSENLKLQYDYDESIPNTKLQSSDSESTESVDKDHIIKTGRTSKHNKKSDSKKKTIDNKRSRDYAKGHYGKKDPTYSETSHSGESGEAQKNSKKKYHSQEEHGSGQEHKNSREAQNSELKGKDVKQKSSHTDERIKGEESVLSLNKENHKPPPSEGKTNREVEETREDIIFETHNTDENIVGENVGVQGTEDGEVYSKTSEHNGDRGFQKQPVIRKEGGKVYTYVQDADYDEYNEKMAKWRETHPEKATDFMT